MHANGIWVAVVPLVVGSVLSVLVLGCGGDADAGPAGSSTSAVPVSPGVVPASSPTTGPVAPAASGDVHAELCQRIAEVESTLATMRAVELRVTNRVALEIELGQLQVAVAELQDADLGAFEDDLETPLQRLVYRLGEVELAVEDFRTNGRPQRAAPHVERDTQTFADELAAFAILSRC